MTYFNMKPGFENKHIVEGYEWAAIVNGLLVDGGGSHGSLSRVVLERYPEIRCVVYDSPDIVKTANVPPALANRLKFQTHDVFTKASPVCRYLSPALGVAQLVRKAFDQDT